MTPGVGESRGFMMQMRIAAFNSLKAAGALATFALCCLRVAAQTEPNAQQVEFFESRVRPIFAEHCYSCHSARAEKLKGGLRLDTSAGIAKGGESGVAIVAGAPNDSLLIKAVRYTDPDLQMPPKGKQLSPEQVALLEQWVKSGATLPRDVSAQPSTNTIAAVRARHWAFQPVVKPPLPAVKNKAWVKTPVDAFVLANLESAHLKPSPPADKRTLLRRVTYDLTGLPPTAEEAEAFLNDRRPDAYERVVERLLASPHYGERWARHWLDVARYADTKGYLAGGEERRYAFSYTYRDYVVKAFNEDKPFSQFVLEQLAADRLPGDDKSRLAALGFLTLGRRFLNNENDIIDDRIDVVSRGLMGLTVACARCHDHKFDPIPSADYYALHGIFASSQEPAEKPLLGPLRDSPQYQDYQKQKAGIEKEIAAFEDGEIAQFLAGLRQNIGDYLLAAHDAAHLAEPSKFDTFAGERKLLAEVLRRWTKFAENPEPKTNAVFSAWFALSELPEKEFAAGASNALMTLNSSPGRVNPLVMKALTEPNPASLRQVAEVYTRLFKETESSWQDAGAKAAKANAPAPTGLEDPAREGLRQALYAEWQPSNLPNAEVRRIHARRLGEGAAPFRNRIEALNWTHPGAPPRAMALEDRTDPHNSHIAKRGNPANPGPEVPRHFPEILCPNGATPFTNGSGRLELAEAIVAPSNPLTARVYVNRVWRHHFGEGLVTTAGDFGVRTETPPERKLLDYLAAWFAESGGSTKELHRLLVLSSTYRESATPGAKAAKADPENHLWHHANRRRLDFEELRDTLLSVSGRLNLAVGGLPVDLASEPLSSRRTLYALIDRQNLPAVFRTFDFANPDTSNQGRFSTTVPQQGLFMLNSPFVMEQAKALAARPEVSREKETGRKVRALYRLLWQREPDGAELKVGEEFLARPARDKGVPPLEQYAQVLLCANELMFVD